MVNERLNPAESSSVTVLHQSHSYATAWDDFSVWYHIAPFEIPTVDDALELIAQLGKLGIEVATVPVLCPDGCSDYIEKIVRKASRRGMRILPNIGFDTMAGLGREVLDHDEAISLIEQWMRAGAWGVELGMERVNMLSGHAHAGQDVRELQAIVAYHNPDAIVSIGLISDNADGIIEHIQEDYFHVVRTALQENPLTPENIGPQLLNAYHMFNAAGTTPAWDLTIDALEMASSRLNVSAVMLIMMALPGMVHFTRGAIERSPSTRHLLRFREALNIANGNLAVDETRIYRGVISLLVDYLDVRINFGWDEEYLANDGSVLATSRIELPRSADGQLVLPTSDSAWVSQRR